MSWSYSGQGKPGEVRGSASQAMMSQKCSEPEESIKMKALDIIEMALGAYPDEQDVSVIAHGSQSKVSGSDRATNSLRIEIKPLPKAD